MDKYEYKLKTEQMLELMEDGAYSKAAEIADTIGKETGAVPFVIDSLVTGDGDKDSYLKGMEENRKVLEEAMQVFGA